LETLINRGVIFSLFLIGLSGPRGRTGKPGSNGVDGIPGICAWQVKVNGTLSNELLIPPSIGSNENSMLKSFDQFY
jgi:hypothetical protein